VRASAKARIEAAGAPQSRGPGRSTGQPLDNPARTVWINETALSTALNVSYMASQLALFGIVVGVALLLSGIGFIVLAGFGTLRLNAGETESASPVTEAAVGATA
jgi:hypothetical protein